MPSLLETQRLFKRAFTDPRGVDPVLDGADGPSLRAAAVDAPPLPLRLRLAVYADAYFWRLLECLGADFAAVKASVGEEPFQELVADYLKRHPSTSPRVNDLGGNFAPFLKTRPVTKEHPYLPDLAALEWAVLHALLTDRLPALDPASLAAVPVDAWPRARLRLDPTATLLETAWPVEKIQRAARRGGKIARPFKPVARKLLVWRHDGWAEIRSLPAFEFQALAGLAAGRPLGQVCDALPPGVPLQAWFAAWTRAGVLKKVEI